MEQEVKTLIRRSEPTKFDHAPEGTLCRVVSLTKEDIYIQRSSDEENPRWEKID